VSVEPAARQPNDFAAAIADIFAAVPNPTADQRSLLEQLGALTDRLRRRRVQIAVLGQFKRGKSTLLNALLGARVLPTAVTPLTAIPTFIQAGRPAVHLVRLDGESQTIEVNSTDEIQTLLAGYVTEEGNPENKMGLTRVDVSIESTALSRGLSFIDTPGIGSTLRHNSATARSTLPHCDVALFTVSPDPPITEIELEYLREVQQTVGRLIVILNKIDMVDARDLEKAESFLRHVLVRDGGLPETTPLFRIAARAELDGVGVPAASQLAQLKRHLTRLGAEETGAVLAKAAKLKMSAVITQLLNGLEIRLKALQMPIEELERRASQFGAAVGSLREERQRADDLLAGDRQRALARIEADAEDLRKRASDILKSRMMEITVRNSASATSRDEVMASIPNLFDRELEAIRTSFAKYIHDLLKPHADRSARLANSVTDTTAKALGVALQHVDNSAVLSEIHEPYWITSGQFEGTIPSSEFLDRFLPSGLRVARIQQRLATEIDDVVSRNVENLRWATLRNAEEAFGRFSDELHAALDTTIDTMNSLLVEAIQTHRRGRAAVTAELEALEESQRCLGRLSNKLASVA
jgi:ribosome biogenesis GTPase A